MKSTTAIKNIRLFKNAQNGRPKRVTTGVDDYGNRFHVVGGKVRPVNNLAKKKKILQRQRENNKLFLMNHRKATSKEVNAYTTMENRKKAAQNTTGKTRKLHVVKGALARKRFYTNTKRSVSEIRQISNKIRRPE